MATMRGKAADATFRAVREAVTAMAPYAPTITMKRVEDTLLGFSPTAAERISRTIANAKDIWAPDHKFGVNMARLIIGGNDEQFALVGIDSIRFLIALNRAEPWAIYADDDRIWDHSANHMRLRAAYVELFRPGNYGRDYLTPERISPLVCAQILLTMLEGERRVAFMPDRFRRLEEVAERLPEIEPALHDILTLANTRPGETGAGARRFTLHNELDAADVLFLSSLDARGRQRVIDSVSDRGEYSRETAVLVAAESTLPLTAGIL